MEENSEVHMATGESSTSKDVVEVQEMTSSHRNVETVVTVEKIKEEDMFPDKEKANSQPKPAEPKSDTELVKAVEKLSPKEMPLKKIIIKAANKDYQIVKIVQKSPNKPDESPTSVGKHTQLNKPVQPTILQSNKDVSPRKSEILKSPNKDTDKHTQKSPVKPSVIQNTSQTNDYQAQELATEALSKISPGKDTAKVTLTKDLPAEGTPTKEVSVKSVPLKEQPVKTSPVKEQLTKSTPSKDTVSKVTIVKELTAKATPVKELIPKATPVKDLMPKATSKDDLPSEKPNADSTISKPEEILSKSSNKVSAMEIDIEASNDSQMETNSDTSEKEHNKSISRELKSLINSAKESKIISEYNQVTSKTRKSRAPLDSSNASLNASVEADKIQGIRRGSDNSQKSGSSERSEKALKRSMRSQNPEFVHKVKQFLNSVTGKVQNEGQESDLDIDEGKSQDNPNEPMSSTSKKKKIEEPVSDKTGKFRSDSYCWRCHWAVEPAANEKAHPPMICTVCPRSFHYKCLTGPERNKINVVKNWVCTECLLILNAEGSETRSPAMKKISLGMLCELLKYALERMMDINGVEPFVHPVDRSVFPDYDKYVVHPMTLSLMKQQIADGHYGSTEAFLADAQWILHNSIIFNTCENLQSKLTGGARALVRSCRAEMGEIEACPECYSAAHARRPTWFTDVCTTPHVLLWAKLKGFPYWPAKGMSVNSSGLVDVRFFGAHDRAWVPARDCFLFSEKDPNNFRTKRQDILDSMQEAEQHIRNISRKYGKFVYPPFKTQFDPSKLYEQLKMMIPSFEGEVRAAPPKEKPAHISPGLKDKSRSMSKSSKGSANDGDTSEGEDTSAAAPRKMADGAEIAREEEDFSVEKDKDKNIEVEVPQNKESKEDTSRKRRRSELEAVITIVSDSTKEKKKRVEDDEKPQEQKPEEKETTPAVSKETTETKEPEKTKAFETPKAKDSEPSTSSVEKKLTPKGAPIRLISIAKVLKTAKVSPAKVNTPNAEKSQQKQKPKLDKSNSSEKINTPEEKMRAQKRRSSKNKSLNSSNAGKTDKGTDKKNEKTDTTNKEKTKDSEANKNVGTNNSVADVSTPEKSTPRSSATDSPKSKDRIQFDDDTTLAVIARGTAKSSDTTVLPTITSVRSLSNPETTVTKTTSAPKTIEITVEAASDSSIFTPTSTDNVRNMKEAVNKLQKLRNETDTPPVGRVGVRAFARMTSPPEETRPNNDVQVEIKTEPMDFDDADRQTEKLDLMNAFKLRPVNGPSNLREVRINKVVVTSVNNKKIAPKPAEIRPRARKTFPQPKKPDDGRSELNSKNSMVYIPIQPPMTQAPLRPQRPLNANGPGSAPAPRAGAPVVTSTSNNVVNTMTTPLVPVSMSSLSSATPTSAPGSHTGSSPLQSVPTVGQVPTTVHTVPLITSVNGQWTFSLQPVMSVGGVDGAPSPPMLNGLPERTNATTPVVPLPSTAPSVASPALVPAAPPSLVAPGTTQTPSRMNSDNNPPGEPPRLQQRPSLMNPLDTNTPVGSVPAPSTAGPLTAKLNQNAVKMTDFFRTLLEDSLEKLEEPATQLTAVKLQLEQLSWRHQQQLDEINHNYELTVAEMRSSFEKEKIRLVSETRRASQVELEAAVKLAKSKQWCANCSQEAQFYCCWNTSYCDYPCQRAHWAQHYAVCTQQRSQDGNNSDNNANPSESRLQPPPENLPKTTAAPNLTVGGKMAPTRVFTSEPHGSPKTTSIIMSMVEDTSGNQSLKCVGTYKPPATPQISPLIINKQLMNNEEAAKKVVTSGGYLIVGAANTSSGVPVTTTSLVTPSRRTHTIQYYT